MPWKRFDQRGANILIIPPTNAICWYFNEHEWEKKILCFLNKILSKEDFKKVHPQRKYWGAFIHSKL